VDARTAEINREGGRSGRHCLPVEMAAPALSALQQAVSAAKRLDDYPMRLLTSTWFPSDATPPRKYLADGAVGRPAPSSSSSTISSPCTSRQGRSRRRGHKFLFSRLCGPRMGDSGRCWTLAGPTSRGRPNRGRRGEGYSWFEPNRSRLTPPRARGAFCASSTATHCPTLSPTSSWRLALPGSRHCTRTMQSLAGTSVRVGPALRGGNGGEKGRPSSVDWSSAGATGNCVVRRGVYGVFVAIT